MDVLTYLIQKDPKADLENIRKIVGLTSHGYKSISRWLNISEATLRSHLQTQRGFKDITREQIYFLLKLFSHGAEAFGDKKASDKWLFTPNFFFDYNRPESFLHTAAGIRFVEIRIKAIEFGDNV